MQQQSDWFEYLKLAPDAPAEQVEKAVERLSRQAAALAVTQPERSQQLRDNVRAIKRDLMSGPENRARYDAARAAAIAATTVAEPAVSPSTLVPPAPPAQTAPPAPPVQTVPPVPGAAQGPEITQGPGTAQGPETTQVPQAPAVGVPQGPEVAPPASAGPWPAAPQFASPAGPPYPPAVPQYPPAVPQYPPAGPPYPPAGSPYPPAGPGGQLPPGAAVAGLESQVQAFGSKIARFLRTGWTCSACGKEAMPSDKFCTKCGTTITPTRHDTTRQSPRAGCANCNAPLSANDAFCSRCGTPAGK
jgi:hypothetical protein